MPRPTSLPAAGLLLAGVALAGVLVLDGPGATAVTTTVPAGGVAAADVLKTQDVAGVHPARAAGSTTAPHTVPPPLAGVSDVASDVVSDAAMQDAAFGAGSALRTTLLAARTITYPQAGNRTYRSAKGRTPVAGTAGPLLRYRVVVENGITGITAGQFAARVVATLEDRRSWTGTGKVRLQRVPGSASSDFTVYLVTPQTRDVLCGDTTGSDPDRYTSCRNGERVVLNVARWVHGVPHYGASLERYRSYLINHETGHRLGYRHQTCPGEGRRAPVMQQQTLELHGCTANAWPRVKGRLYTGPAGAYQDPIPPA